MNETPYAYVVDAVIQPCIPFFSALVPTERFDFNRAAKITPLVLDLRAQPARDPWEER